MQISSFLFLSTIVTSVRGAIWKNISYIFKKSGNKSSATISSNMASLQLRKSAVEATEMAKEWYQRCKFENFNSKDRSPCIEKVGRVRGMARRESNSRRRRIGRKIDIRLKQLGNLIIPIFNSNKILNLKKEKGKEGKELICTADKIRAKSFRRINSIESP